MNTTTTAPEQTARQRMHPTVEDRCTPDQLRAIGLLIQALEADDSPWSYDPEGLDVLNRSTPFVHVWPVDSAPTDMRTLRVEVDTDGEIMTFDGAGYGDTACFFYPQDGDVLEQLDRAWIDEHHSFASPIDL